MVDQAEVYVKNHLTDAIGAVRSVPGEPEISIASGDKEIFYLIRTQISLTIKAPPEVNAGNCPFKVSNEELLSWEANDDLWTVEIKENSLPPETPTSATVDVGEEET
jgi:hypothetical protein